MARMKKNTEVAPVAVSPGQAATALGISVGMVYKMLGDGRLPSFKIGAARRIPFTAIRALVESPSDAA